MVFKRTEEEQKRYQEAMDKAMQKSIEREKEFLKSENTDYMRKRMGQDLFKGGMK